MSKWASWQSPSESKELDESGRFLSLQTEFVASSGMAAKYRDEAPWRELGAAVRFGKFPLGVGLARLDLEVAFCYLKR